jgi:hypothetical protein
MSLLTNLIHYFKMDGNSNDIVGADNGTDTAITYNAGNGKISLGAGFNGTTSEIILGTAIPMQTNLTIAAWVKTANLGTRQVIFGDSDATATQVYELDLQASQKLRFQWSSSGTDFRSYITDAIAINDNNWHHIVVTQVGTGAPQFYVDGVAVSSSLSGSGGAATKPAAQTSAIGEYGGYAAGLSFWNGAIDELGYWSRALSSADVTQLYNGGAGISYPFGPVSTNLFRNQAVMRSNIY